MASLDKTLGEWHPRCASMAGPQHGSRGPSAGELPGIAGIAPGDPVDPLTWSGISRSVLAALADRQALIGAVDGSPRALVTLEKVASFSPDRRRWRQRYYAGASPLSPVIRRGMSRLAARRLRQIGESPGVLLQFGAWCDFTIDRRLKPGLRASYHDG